jgi:hypothetical protein
MLDLAVYGTHVTKPPWMAGYTSPQTSPPLMQAIKFQPPDGNIDLQMRFTSHAIVHTRANLYLTVLIVVTAHLKYVYVLLPPGHHFFTYILKTNVTMYIYVNIDSYKICMENKMLSS